MIFIIKNYPQPARISSVNFEVVKGGNNAFDGFTPLGIPEWKATGSDVEMHHRKNMFECVRAHCG